MVEEHIADMCAPTLAGFKCGSLFNIKVDYRILSDKISEVNSQLVPHGIIATVFRLKCCTLIYVYRDDLLRRMTEPDSRVSGFLEKLGYCTTSTETLIDSLRRRIDENGWVPHEIGLFLGYPYDDVMGFIRDGGKHAKCSGCWRVYGSVEDARRMFLAIKRCRDDFRRRYSMGISLSQLANSAATA